MRSPREQLWIVAYDSPSNRRRRKITTQLEGYGVRVQWSVFECRLRAEEIRILESRMKRVIHAGEDSVRLWPLSEASLNRVVQLGRMPPSPAWDDSIV